MSAPKNDPPHRLDDDIRELVREFCGIDEMFSDFEDLESEGDESTDDAQPTRNESNARIENSRKGHD